MVFSVVDGTGAAVVDLTCSVVLWDLSSVMVDTNIVIVDSKVVDGTTIERINLNFQEADCSQFTALLIFTKKLDVLTHSHVISHF